MIYDKTENPESQTDIIDLYIRKKIHTKIYIYIYIYIKLPSTC